MDGIEVFFSVLCVILLGIYIYLLYRRYENFWKSIVLSFAVVMLQSHLYHVFFGEQIAAELCAGVNKDLVLGHWKCSAWSYDYLLDSYEITVAFSISTLAGLMFLYVPPKHIFQFVALCLQIGLSLLLFFLPYGTLRDYAIAYNYVSSLLCLSLVVDELYDMWNVKVVYSEVEVQELV